MNFDVNVLMTVYREPIFWVVDSLESVFAESGVQFNVVLVIDGSDRSDLAQLISTIYAITHKYRKELILKVNEKNIGLALSLNRGLEFCDAKYVARLDSDDRCKKGRLMAQFDYLSHRPDVAICGSSAQIIDEDGSSLNIKRVITNSKALKIFYYFNSGMLHPSMMIRTDVLKEVKYKHVDASQDYLMVREVLSKGYKVANLCSPFIDYRINSNSISTKNGLKQYLSLNFMKTMLYKGRSFDRNEYLNYLNQATRNYSADYSELALAYKKRDYLKVLLLVVKTPSLFWINFSKLRDACLFRLLFLFN